MYREESRETSSEDLDPMIKRIHNKQKSWDMSNNLLLIFDRLNEGSEYS